MHPIRWPRSVYLAVLIVGGGAVFRDLGQAQSFDSPDPMTVRSVSFDEMVSLEETFTRLVEQAVPSVVAVRVARSLAGTTASDRGPDGDITINQAPEQPVTSAGCGVVLRPDGYILTNEHVITGADEITVVLHDGARRRARLVAADLRSDLAVIRIDRDDLKPAKFGDLAQVRRGQWAFAVGDPFGFAGDGQLAVSVGHVSALGRALQRQLDPSNVRYYGNLIQTTAPINPGNSGGPLLNLRGEVVGINTAIQTRSGTSEGVGFAVPISERTRSIIEVLLRGEEVSYGYLGVHVRRPTDEEWEEAGAPPPYGALVSAVESGAPADAADLQVGDLIVEYDGAPTESADHLVRLVGMTPVDTRVILRFYRSGTKRTAVVVIARRPARAPNRQPRVKAGRAAPGPDSA